jgi:DNA primase
LSLFPQQFIDDVKLQANIVQVVQEYVPLKRAGTTYKGSVRSTRRRHRRST